MKTKKWISVMMAGLLAASLLTGCGRSDTASDQTEGTQAAGGQEDTREQEEESTKVSQAAETTEGTGGSLEETGAGAAAGSESPEDGAVQGGKTLVVYFSAGGHTGAVADAIADAVGADLFVLEPVEPYTDDDLDYTDDNSRVSKEHEDEAQRDVELTSVTVEDWESYETVFIGYPIWWGIAAWPVDSFVEENDFTGKTVIPFCTSASSGLGESGKLLEEKAGTGNWQEGMRFRSSVAEEDVRNWVSGLGLGQ